MLAVGSASAATTPPGGLVPDPGNITRIAGADRYETAVEISTRSRPVPGNSVFIASGEDFADALTAANYANGRQSLLLVQKDFIPESVRTRLTALEPYSINIVGGPSAVSPAVATQLERYGPVVRKAGADRYSTSARAYYQYAIMPDEASYGGDILYLASGLDFPDALSAVAAAQQRPDFTCTNTDDACLLRFHRAARRSVLLVPQGGLTAEIRRVLAIRPPDRVVLVGGADAVPSLIDKEVRALLPKADVVRYEGTDRYKTAAVVAAQVWPQGAQRAFFASGFDFPDALTASAISGDNKAPLLLTTPECTPAVTARAAASLKVVDRFVFGGPAVTADPSTVCGTP